MTDKLEITHKFEKNEFWATPIWKADFDNIDNRKISEGKIGEFTKNLQKKYFDTVTGENSDYLNWCTRI